jgi:hypothetical protein
MIMRLGLNDADYASEQPDKHHRGLLSQDCMPQGYPGPC